MGTIHRLRNRGLGAHLLPRQVADRGQLNWPKCALCGRAVDAYGIEEDAVLYVEIWAECTGIRLHPDTGAALPGATKVHDKRRGSIKVLKAGHLDISNPRFTDMVRRLAFFAPELAERNFDQGLTNPDTIAKVQL
jgi:hypothetical protein